MDDNLRYMKYVYLVLKMIQLPSKDENGHDDNNNEKYDHSNDRPCDYPNLHVVVLADVICVKRSC